MKQSMFIVLLVSAGIIASATGLKCYTCEYSNVVNDPKCQDENILDATEFLKECPELVNGACAKISSEVGDLTSVSRYCAAASGVTEMGCSENEVLGIKASACYCDTDGCNGSTSLKVTSALLLAIPAYLAKFYYY